MSIESVMKRVAELEGHLHQVAAQHNVVLGQLAEAKNLLEMLKAGVDKAEQVVDVVADTAKAVETVIDGQPEQGSVQ